MRIFFDFAEYNMGTITISREIPTGILERKNADNVVIFPSPTHNQLKISGAESGKKFSILNVFGEVMQKGIITENNTIDIKFLKNGNYFLHIEVNNGIQTKKFIKL